MKKEIKIVIVGNLCIFHNALARLLERDDRFRITGKVAKIEDVSKLPEREAPDVVLVILSENQNADFFSSLVDPAQKMTILVLTDSGNVQLHNKCLRAGISGLILKNKSARMLSKAIEKVYQGEYWFDRSLMGRAIRQLIGERQKFEESAKSSALNDFSERERQIILLICQGLKNQEIADRLFIAETTVRHHLSSIFDKLSISSRLELVVYAFENNLVKKSPKSKSFLREPETSVIRDRRERSGTVAYRAF